MNARLFLLERTALSELAATEHTPLAGDVVVTLRGAQHDEGEALLIGRGVRVVSGDSLLNPADETAIDEAVDALLEQWCGLDGGQPQAPGQISLGFFTAHFVVGVTQPGHLMRFGEIARRALDLLPEAQVVTDLLDGGFPIVNLNPDMLPRREMLGVLAAETGRGIQDIVPARPLPTLLLWGSTDLRIGQVLKTYLGGLRPKFLRDRLALWLCRSGRKRFYIFLNHGIKAVAKILAADPKVDVLTDQPINMPQALALRYDHMLPFPSLRYLVLFRRQRQGLSQLVTAPETVAVLNGFSYGRFLLPALQAYAKWPLLMAAIRASQTERFWRMVRPDVVVTNGDVNVVSRATIRLAPHLGYQVVHIDHGLNSTPYGYWTIGGNHEDVLFAVPGDAYRGYFGRRLPAEKRREVLVPLPLTAQMEPIRGQRKPSVHGRVLLLNYSPAWTHTVGRVRWLDRYMVDTLAACRRLVDEGVEVTIRPHTAFNHDYVHHFITRAGLEGRVSVDNAESFPHALARHDILVTNLSTCYYQGLYAGWPTIVYQPEFRRSDYLGALADSVMDTPLAQTPDKLVQLVLEARDSNSRVARFPEEFMETHAPRFIGTDLEHTAQQLATMLMGVVRP